MLGDFTGFLLSGDLFPKDTFLKKYLNNTINSLDPEQAQHFVSPDWSLNCFQRSTVDDIGK